MTAEVALAGARRPNAVRIPNSALAARRHGAARGRGNGPVPSMPTSQPEQSVWEYDGKRFTPIAVRTGLADRRWTELLSGSIHPGDALVTGAVFYGQRPRI